jgi:A/G-specific adenine glycosylase
MSRINADYSDIKAAATKKKVAAQLAELYPEKGKALCGDFTQGLIELGAMVCVPNGRPQCEICPAAEFCRARAEGVQMDLPVKAEKKGRRIEERTVFILTNGSLEEGGRMAVRKRPAEGLLANLAELPNVLGELTPDQALQKAWEWGCSPAGLTRSSKFKHIFSHVEWHMTGYYITCGDCGTPDEGEPFHWVTAEEMDAEVPLPSILYVTFLIVYQAIAHADVDTAVSRSTEDQSLSPRMRGTERQAVGIYGTKVHLPAVRPGEIVGKAE